MRDVIGEISRDPRPVLIGAGNPLFKRIEDRLTLELKQLASGVVVLYYQKAGWQIIFCGLVDFHRA